MNNEKFSVRKRIKSFSYAFAGLKVLFREEHNARIHAVAAVLAATYPDINWIEGLRLNGMSDDDLQAWVEACLSDKQK